MKLTKDEKKLVEYAKKAVVRYNKKRHAKGKHEWNVDTVYAFVMSDTGKIYDGACLETTVSGGVCAERHAIANMVLNETYRAKIKSIVIPSPVPKVLKKSTTPCGLCRHVIWERGTSNTTVICLQYIQKKNGWIFPKMDKYTIKELYPNPFEMVKWD